MKIKEIVPALKELSETDHFIDYALHCTKCIIYVEVYAEKGNLILLR